METTTENSSLGLTLVQKVVTRICPDCQNPFESKCAELNGVLFGVTHCETCEARRVQKQARDAQEPGATASRWSKVCPAAYRATDPARLPQQALGRVMQWRMGERGLAIKGDSGVGKTRLMWWLLRRLIDDEGRKVEVFDSVSLGQAIARAYGESRGDEFLQQTARAEILAIDDLGKMRMTERAEESLFWLVEKRTSEGLPILLTTQYDGKTLPSRFTLPETGIAVIRRIREFCASIIVEP